VDQKGRGNNLWEEKRGWKLLYRPKEKKRKYEGRERISVPRKGVNFVRKREKGKKDGYGKNKGIFFLCRGERGSPRKRGTELLTTVGKGKKGRGAWKEKEKMSLVFGHGGGGGEKKGASRNKKGRGKGGVFFLGGGGGGFFFCWGGGGGGGGGVVLGGGGVFGSMKRKTVGLLNGQKGRKKKSELKRGGGGERWFSREEEEKGKGHRGTLVEEKEKPGGEKGRSFVFVNTKKGLRGPGGGGLYITRGKKRIKRERILY